MSPSGILDRFVEPERTSGCEEHGELVARVLDELLVFDELVDVGGEQCAAGAEIGDSGFERAAMGSQRGRDALRVEFEPVDEVLLGEFEVDPKLQRDSASRVSAGAASCGGGVSSEHESHVSRYEGKRTALSLDISD